MKIMKITNGNNLHYQTIYPYQMIPLSQPIAVFPPCYFVCFASLSISGRKHILFFNFFFFTFSTFFLLKCNFLKDIFLFFFLFFFFFLFTLFLSHPTLTGLPTFLCITH
nr:uncharacterized protein SPBC713.13 [Schizosaccharomyces pombe]G2TRS5.1 RecName: Full=Putative uncharacterized transmembrane protein SPBC713.13 [Schizosaccharomyces pombe 972h-]CCD31356.1 dubious [Schizosaccharomyces pombe]|eukprot:NP_001343146.1 uncharacterized protein SPBC713.13 [Schizosaccharomyces pombe]